jgi:hypothetical protein
MFNGNDNTVRSRLLRLRERGHIVEAGTRGGRVPLVLMRGDGWLPQSPWSTPENNSRLL